ncbi:MAG TPA: hypothetical protein VGV92_00420 [Gammaproteobacteria bacterium]|nr:hypothetical protein [Gammaproteobacteria bacterium]
MINRLLQTLNIFAQLKTYYILKSYEKANVITQEQFRQTEMRRVAENRYDMQAYLRLSIMRPKRTEQYTSSLKAIGFSDKHISSTLNRMQERYSRAYGALLTRRGAAS